MTRWRLTVEYDGAPFVGWQRQAIGESVQGVLERAIDQMTSERVTLHGAGRTDAGVHALAMEAHCDIARPMTEHRLREGLNALVRPSPVSVVDVRRVPDDWHARFSCVGRRYLYRILNRRAPPSLDRGKVWHIGHPLNLEAMSEASAKLLGTHDFTTFRSVHCQSPTPVKTLDRLFLERVGDEVHIRAEARSFLHHQVRSMVGCLALVGRGRWTAGDVAQALAAKDRAALGLNAPSAGLYFVEALYPTSSSRAAG